MVDVLGSGVDASAFGDRLRVYALADLKPYERNARKHSKRQLQVLADQIKASGFNAPIAVWRDGMVLAGHGRVEAAKVAGLAEAPGIDCSHLSLLDARKYVLADNRIAEMAKWDDASLKAELADLHELAVDFADVGFSPNELSKLVENFDVPASRREAARQTKPTEPKPWTEVRAEASQQSAAPSSPAPDGAPAEPVEVAPPPKGDQAELWILPDPESANERAIAEAETDPLLGPVIAAEGELWIIPADPENPAAGEHRLVCGSCLDAATVARVCGEGDAAMLLTDPPYGVDYAGKVRAQNKALGLKGNDTEIASDDLPLEKLREFLGAAFANARTALRPGGAVWAFSAPGSDGQLAVMLALMDAGLPTRHGLSWVKNQMVLSRADINYRHEALHYGWKPGAAHQWHGPTNEESVWECPKPRASKAHPTMKPVALLERALRNSSVAGEVVLDLFGGSGSLLEACHNRGRLARLTELSPGFASVILRRAVLCGLTPIREDGASIEDAMKEREAAGEGERAAAE
jgi:DNA modification methylase